MIYIHTHTQTYIHTCMHTQIHTHIYIHAYIHTYIHMYIMHLHNIMSTHRVIFEQDQHMRPDSVEQWHDSRPECWWEARGPEFYPRPGRVGVRFLYEMGQPPKTFISYSLLSAAQLLGEITLKSFIFISCHRSCYLCRLHILKSSPSYMSEPPLKKGGNPFFKEKKIKKKRLAYGTLRLFEALLEKIIYISKTRINCNFDYPELNLWDPAIGYLFLTICVLHHHFMGEAICMK